MLIVMAICTQTSIQAGQPLLQPLSVSSILLFQSRCISLWIWSFRLALGLPFLGHIASGRLSFIILVIFFMTFLNCSTQLNLLPPTTSTITGSRNGIIISMLCLLFQMPSSRVGSYIFQGIYFQNIYTHFCLLVHKSTF